MLDADLKTQLKAYLEKLVQPIELVAALDDGAQSRELEELLAEIAALSDKITLRRDDGDARKPSFAINRVRRADIGVRFAGIPHGPRIHLAGAGAAAGRRPPVQGDAGRHRAGARRSTATICSRPISRCPARTARTWCRR